jgi:protein translocase SecG subunit
MVEILKIVEVVVAILLSVLILMQQRGSGMGSAIGGTGGGEFYATKRGAEKVLAQFTVALAVIFCALPLIISILS